MRIVEWVLLYAIRTEAVNPWREGPGCVYQWYHENTMSRNEKDWPGDRIARLMLRSATMGVVSSMHRWMACWVHQMVWGAGLCLLLGCSSPSSKPVEPGRADGPSSVASRKAPDPDEKFQVGTATAVVPASDRKVVAAFITQSGGVPYRSARIFEAQTLPFSKVPGSGDVAARLALLGQPTLDQVVCIDRLSEALVDSLGQKIHTIGSYRAYLEPVYGQTVAFDLATSSGGVPQRMVGHLTKNGCHLVLYRGGRLEEEKDIEFAPGVEIFPVDVEFVHYFFERNKDREEMVRTLFVPEIAGFAEVSATREGTETIASGGRNYECAKYLLRTGSSKAREGITTQQYVWFDKQQGMLIRRADVKSHSGYETVVERVEPEQLTTLTALVVRSPQIVARRPFPYPLDRELLYQVRMGDQRLGEIRVSFARQPADAKGPEGWRSRALVNLNMKNEQETNARQEEAVTRFDAGFYPIDYLAIGQETAGGRAEYTLHARFSDGTVGLRVRRESGPRDLKKPAAETTPTGVGVDWDEPLRRISIAGDDRDNDENQWKVQNVRYERPLSANVFAFDYHRVEHMAVVLYRLPLPVKEARGKDAEAGQNLAFYAVRQNLSTLVPFVVSREPRATEADSQAPDIFLVKVGGQLMSGRAIMDSNGRLLQWTTRCGTQEIVYSLDDPIMHERERHLDRTPAQDGPILIRPPWY